MNVDRAIGFYQIPEAARYLRAYFAAHFAEEDALSNVTPQKLGRWVREGLADPRRVDSAEGKQWITFEELVSLQIVAALRSKLLPMQRIRNAQNQLRDRTGHAIPFAIEDIWTNKHNIFSQIDGVMAAADKADQLAFEFVRERLLKVHRLTFDRAGGVKSWEPMDRVLLNPRIQFGSPCIKGTRIQTWVLSDLARYGESEESIREDYGVTRADIEAAMEWEALTTGQPINVPVPA